MSLLADTIIPHLTDGELRSLLYEIKAEVCVLTDVYEVADDQFRRQMETLLEAEILGQMKELLTFRRGDPLFRELRELNPDRGTDAESAREGVALANHIAKEICAFSVRLRELEQRMRELTHQAEEHGMISLEDVVDDQEPLVHDAIRRLATEPDMLRAFLTARRDGMLDRQRRLLDAQIEAYMLMYKGRSPDEAAAAVRAHGLDEVHDNGDPA